MHIQRPHWLIAGGLALVLLAAGCSPSGPTSRLSASAASPTAAQPPATAPAATRPSATAAPAATVTAIPAATAAPASPPTSVPTSAPAAPTQAPATSVPAAPTAEPIAILPASRLWVRIGDTIIAPGDTPRMLDLQSLDYPLIRDNALAAPDGTSIAYVSQEDRLVIVDMSGSVWALPEGREIQPVGFSFSPNGRALAFTLTDSQRWRLQVLDIPSGGVRTLQEGLASSQPQSELATAPRPLAWTLIGLIVDRVLWGSDATPLGIALVGPADGSVQALSDTAHLRAIPAPDGTKVALVVGEVPIGGTPMAQITILDIASGHETVITPLKQGFVKALHWSPDGTMLLYATSEAYESLVTSVSVLNADGTNEQRVDFGVKGLELKVHDLAWQDSKTALVLIADQNGKIELNALPISSFDPTGLRPLAAFGKQAADQVSQILYVPRGG